MTSTLVDPRRPSSPDLSLRLLAASCTSSYQMASRSIASDCYILRDGISVSTFQVLFKSIVLGSTDRTIPWKLSHVEFVYTLPEPGPDQAYIDLVLVVRPRSRDCASFFSFNFKRSDAPSLAFSLRHWPSGDRTGRSGVRGLRRDIENHSRTILPWSLCQMDAGRGRVERGRKGRHTGTS